jgi:hypothetical protein
MNENEHPNEDPIQKANDWFLKERAKALTEWEAMPQGKNQEMTAKLERMREINKVDLQHEKVLSASAPNQSVSTSDYTLKNTTPPPAVKSDQRPTFYVNQTVNQDIAQYREQKPEFEKKVAAMHRDELEDEYLLSVMKRDGYEPGVHLQDDLQKFREESPSLAKRAQVMPREYLENKYTLTQMKREGYNPEIQKMKSFLNRPENQEIKEIVERQTSQIRNPEVRERVAYTRKAPQILKAHGIIKGRTY